MSACWAGVGYAVYKIDSSYPLFNCFAYIFVYGGTSVQILKFAAIILLLYQRFNHLSDLVLPQLSKRIKVKIINQISYDLRLDDIWWLHYNLSSAAEEINRVYSVQLLIWIFSFSLNGLSRIYTLITPEDDSVFSKLRDILCATGCFINLLIITVFCHVTSKKANRVRENVFAPYSVVAKNSHLIQEHSPAIVYFCVKKLSFTAASGFIHVHLPLLLSIAGAMTTYLVIIYKSPSKLA
ncbi:uncharacterized protein LOC122849373 [Aphidius gifuensis]|nr:uncharacterized protein LOC122849373 [Aphidius gifuensis]